MYKHLIVPLDGSASGEAILPLVAQLADKMQARVTLLHVIEENAPRTVHGERHLISEAEAVAYLEQVEQKFFPASLDVSIHVQGTAVPDIAKSIVAHATASGADLIAICTHGRGGVARFLFGSIAQQVLSLARLSVLVLYPHKLERPAGFDGMRFLVPLDGHPEHEQGFRVALQLARVCSASLHLVMAVHTLSTLPGEHAASAMHLPGTTKALLEIRRQSGLRYLHDLIRSAGDAAIPMTLEVRRGHPARAIANAARRAGSNLIVMGTHGKSSMDSFWADSLTPKVARRVHIPLLWVPVGDSRVGALSPAPPLSAPAGKAPGRLLD